MTKQIKIPLLLLALAFVISLISGIIASLK